ncbi:glutamine cyclotransferase [Tribonema minus]|uniref:Glutamine cyclotransferase n=1 Tax=Tribonema minus TaxID=303371 RepID=A0A835Z8N0_9STRA|nr:glutamine cyclotransferase [Tribonema minus]
MLELDVEPLRSWQKGFDTSRYTSPSLQYEVIEVYRHDAWAFTQGLDWSNGFLYEGTGSCGKSKSEASRLPTMSRVLLRRQLPDKYFGEGMAVVNDTIHQLTWHHNRGFIWNATTLEPLGSFDFKTSTGEGWGLTWNGQHLIVSDGSSTLHFWDPVTHKTVRKIQVKHKGRPVDNLDELEFAHGHVLANIWLTDLIARIDPHTGEVMHMLDFSSIYPQIVRDNELTSIDAVLNGIAYDPREDVLYITGKLWPRLYKVRLFLTRH